MEYVIVLKQFFLFLLPLFLFATEHTPSKKNEQGVIFPDIQKIIDRKKLIIAIYEAENPPFFYTENNETLGIDVDLAKEIAQQIDPSIEVIIHRKAKTFNDVADIVSRGEADLGISFLSYTSQRARKVFYTRSPYTVVRTALLVDRAIQSKYPEHNTLKKLFSKKLNHTICVIEGSSYVDMAKRILPEAQLHFSKDSPSLFEDLKTKKCIAILEDDQAIHKKIAQSPQLNLNYQPITLKKETDPILIITNPNSQNLANFVELYMQNTKKYPQKINKLLKDNEKTFLNKAEIK